ncbi:TRAP transporter large permease [Petroclostridium sp. X23]|uniref:TRAP transporter large permease n=1 Tax=Petroclostridium sp. X23 TaxID=3045146 RepID=UPI0024AD8116|nr:TRAP transporter large permease [Petroclostridium sp. X23]WHH58025.1 TRAP transporter large permease [Petroclostridium sp. X23]
MIEFTLATVILVVTLFLGVPIAFAIGITTFIYIFTTNPQNITVIPLRMFAGVDSFILMALPLFVLAAEIMVKAGISTKLFNFVRLILGRLRGGLAYVNIMASTIFGSISGAALSDIAGLGYVEINAMRDDGYKNDFSCAITAASSIQSPLIPPSNIAVLYAGIMALSVGAIFLAGIIPGLLLAGGQMLYTAVMAKKLNLPKHDKKYSSQEVFMIIKEGAIAILMPAIILVGILKGFFTPTEAAGIAVLYAVIIGFLLFRNVAVKDITAALWTSAQNSASLFIIISISSVFAWALGVENVPEQIAQFLLGITDNPLMMLLIVNIILIIVGMWMETGAAIVLFAPILAPIAYKVGIHPVHFAVVMIVNLTVGLITPPIGVVLYATAAVGKEKFENVVKATLPFIIIGFIVVAVMTLFPELALFLPRYFGFI